jgi:hypothetical protein
VPSWRLPLTLLVLPLLAGCSGDPTGPRAGDHAVAALDFSVPLDVLTTPDEPNEVRGFLRVGWSGDAMAIESESEPDLARRTVVEDGKAYTSATGMGWVVQDLGPALGSRLSTRIVLWDLQALLQDPGLHREVHEQGDAVNLTLAGRTGPEDRLEVEAWVLTRAGLIVEAWLDSPQGREGPYRFTPSGGPLAFPVEVPATAMPLRDVQEKDSRSYGTHGQVIGLVRDYASRRAGVLPDRLDPETLQVELLASGKAWPDGAYDGQPVRDSEASGHFSWTRCTLSDGLYVGYGWDGAVLSERFGAGCP